MKVDVVWDLAVDNAPEVFEVDDILEREECFVLRKKTENGEVTYWLNKKFVVCLTRYRGGRSGD